MSCLLGAAPVGWAANSRLRLRCHFNRMACLRRTRLAPHSGPPLRRHEQVGNAIGRGNRHLFLTFLWLELGAILVSTLLAVVRIHDGVTAASKWVSRCLLSSTGRGLGWRHPDDGGSWQRDLGQQADDRCS